MKKILILLVSVLGIVAFLLIKFSEEDIHNKKMSSANQMTSISAESDKPTSEKSQDNNPQVVKTSDKPKSQTQGDSQSDVASCIKGLEEEYPELNERFHQIIEEFYFSREEMLGEGGYQSMSLDDLKILADANDSKAMMTYGSELIWLSSLGVRQGQQSSQYRSHEETKEIVGSHVVDPEGVRRGEEYLFKAGVFGKVGSIFEMYLLLDMVALQLDKKSAEPELVHEFLAKSLAYKKLLEKIHQKDLALQKGFVDLMNWNDSIQRLYADHEDYEDIRKKVENNAEKMYLQFQSDWTKERQYYGFDVYPDYLQGELESFGNDYLDCYQHPL